MITMDDKGLTMSKTVFICDYFMPIVVYYITYKDVYKRILSWEASMKKQFMEFLDDIVTTVIDNCEVEEREWTNDAGKKEGDYKINPRTGIEEKLLSVIKKHLDKVD